MKAALTGGLVVVLLALGTACGGAGDSGAKKGGEATPITKVPPADEGDQDVEAKGSVKGWRYEGNRDSCFYLVKGTCYEAKAEACRAAGCADDCWLEGAGPVTVSCPGR